MAIAEKISQNTYLVSCPLYGLKIERHLVSVLSEGLSMAVLDIRSAVPRTLEDDSGAVDHPSEGRQRISLGTPGNLLTQSGQFRQQTDLPG